MRETPPYSLVEIQLLLTQYLDGILDMEQMLCLDDLMEQYPLYREEFLKLQAAQCKVQVVLQTPMGSLVDSHEDEDHSTWLRIAEQLEHDREKPVSAVTPEWISAYVDGQVPRQDAQRQAFESQLAQNPESIRLLSEFQEISETVRRFGYRLEAQCTLDIAQQVMARFQDEQAQSEQSRSHVIDPLDETQLVDVEWVLLSAFSDQALPPREIIRATQLIESSETARMRLAAFNDLSTGIHRMNERLQTQAPDLWPAIKGEAQASFLAVEPRLRRLQWLKQAAIPIAATFLLAMLSLTILHLNGRNPTDGESQISSSQTLHSFNQTQQIATAQPDNTGELASVPGHASSSVRLVEYTRSDLNGQEAMTSTDAETTVNLPASSSVDSHPAAGLKAILEHSTPVIAADMPHSVLPANETTSHKAPTSEAYLFDALSRKVPEEEISNILGK